MYGDATVRVLTADETGTSNGIVAKHGRIRVHKVVLESATSNAVTSVALHDALTVTGTEVIGLTTNEVTATIYQRYAEANFDPPVPFEVGLSVNITGTATCRIYYTPA